MNYNVRVFVSNMDEIIQFVESYKVSRHCDAVPLDVLFENIKIEWGQEAITN